MVKTGFWYGSIGPPQVKLRLRCYFVAFTDDHSELAPARPWQQLVVDQQSRATDQTRLVGHRGDHLIVSHSIWIKPEQLVLSATATVQCRSRSAPKQRTNLGFTQGLTR